MKKRIILAMCCIMAAFACGCGQTEELVTETTESMEEVSEEYKEMKVVISSDRDKSNKLQYEYDEYGRVYKCTAISWTNNKPADYFIHEYDEEDRCISQTFYNKENEITRNREWEYDALGNCVKDITYDADGNIIAKDVCVFDENGNILKREIIDNYGIETVYEYAYDESGYLICDTKKASNSEMTIKNEYVYNENGDLYRMNTYWDDTERGYCEYTYDDKGRCVEEFSTLDKVETRYERMYDDFDKIIEEKFYYMSTEWELGSHIQYSYNEDGQISKEISGQTGLLSKEYIYDENGNILCEKNYDEAGEISYYVEYTYDEDGDLLSMYHYDGAGNRWNEGFEVYEYGYIQVIEK